MKVLVSHGLKIFMIKLLLLAISVPVFFFFCMPVMAGGNDYLIVPGNRMGSVRLNIQQRDLEQTYGRLTPATENLMMYHFKLDRDQVEVKVEKSNSRVSIVYTTSEKYRLANGICVGASEKDVIGKYGKPDINRYSPKIKGYGWIYSKLGLGFEIINGKVGSILVTNAAQ